ncbi:MAG TPA: MlaD family protein [Planctomycetota bacterium]|nr:MlaD family protein [Planctomycetota bacterium]
MANSGYAHSEVKAGCFITLCIALLVGMMFMYSDWSRRYKGSQEISVAFASVTALRPNAPVRYNGVEVGRVKEIRILHLKEGDLKRLPSLTAGELDKLPLTDTERKQLRAMPAAAFSSELEKILLKRTMINLILEVINEHDTKRFREDDDIRINTTLMGDTSVEIASGSGEPLAENRMVLGRSGDFFTNLARSVEQVKEILSSVSDVVGKDERESVRKALRRFDTITERLEKIVTVVDDRLPKTWDRVDKLADGAQSNFTRIGDAVVGVEPDVKKTLHAATDAVTDLRDRVGKLADEAKDAVREIKNDVKPVFQDLTYITSKSKDDVPAMVKNARDLAARFQGSAGELDKVLAAGERMIQESYPDVRRLVLALRLGAENFEEGTNLLKRKPWLIYNPAKEDPTVVAAQKNARDLEIATKRFNELSTELQAVRRNMDRTPKEKLDRIDYIVQELNILAETLKYAGDATRRDVLTPFERKKGGLVPAIEEIDPELQKLQKKRPETENP